MAKNYIFVLTYEDKYIDEVNIDENDAELAKELFIEFGHMSTNSPESAIKLVDIRDE